MNSFCIANLDSTGYRLAASETLMLKHHEVVCDSVENTLERKLEPTFSKSDSELSNKEIGR